MPAKKKAKTTRRAKRKGDDPDERELVVAEKGQVYGHVLTMLGNGRLKVLCSDGATRQGVICGWLRRRKIYVKVSDIVLVSLRVDMTSDEKADVVHVYTPKDTVKLLKGEHIKESIVYHNDDALTTCSAEPSNFEF